MKAVIATTTWYKDLNEVRARQALNTIEASVRLGHKIVVVDGSSDYIKDYFRALGAIVLDEEIPGMGPCRRQAIRKAVCLAEPDGAVVWLEPEKTPVIFFLTDLLRHFFNNRIELFIPGRSSLSSYPEFQQKAEWLGNKTFQLLTGKDLDVWGGPRIFLPSIAPYFLDYRGEYGDKWDSIFIPILRAIKDGRKVEGKLIDFIYPEAQAKEEENSLVMCMKRIEQLSTLAKALYEESKVLGFIT